MDHNQPYQDSDRTFSRSKWALIGFLVVIAFFLWTEHRAHVMGILPYLLLLACPLMHLFHHGHGHGHHHRGRSYASDAGNAGKAQEHTQDGS